MLVVPRWRWKVSEREGESWLGGRRCRVRWRIGGIPGPGRPRREEGGVKCHFESHTDTHTLSICHAVW